MMPTPADDTTLINPSLAAPRRPRRRRISWLGLVFAAVVGSVAAAWALGYSPRRLVAMARAWKGTSQGLATLAVDLGDIPMSIVESGTLESSNSVPVKCQVKALLGTVNSAVGGMMQGGGAGRGGSGGGGSGSGQPRMAGTAGQMQATTKGATTKGAGGTGTAATKGAGGAAGAAGGVAGAAGMAGGAGASNILRAPMIRSFTYVVMPYVPLRGAMPTAGRASTVANSAAMMQGGGGGRGGGGRGGGDMGERSGSTRILSILPEGTLVKKGEIVCELDSSVFENELAAQKIKWAQAKSWVEQAEKMLAVNTISLEEYRDGILPQDRLLIQQYIASCQTQLAQARDDLTFGEKLFKQGLKTASQVKANRFNYERAEIALQEANRMAGRLEKFTAPRLLTNLDAKLDSIRSDLLAQQESFSLEDKRLKDIAKMIEFCTIRAPLDGVVVYANQANAWGRVDDQIREGVAVREGQPIFTIPDPTRMRVKARVNESKVAQIDRGQPVEVITDAFPDCPFRGRVAEVTAIPAPAAGPISDVKLYYAWVDIETGDFDDLRPGMSAEVSFIEEARRQVTRVPVQAIRRAGPEAYVAVPAEKGFRWQPVELGAANPSHAEVLSGLKPGDRVVADPSTLPPPPAARPATAARLSGVSTRS